MTTATKLIFIVALVLSIIIPFGYYLIGEKNKKRYKRTIGVNAFFFFGCFCHRIDHDAWRTNCTRR